MGQAPVVGRVDQSGCIQQFQRRVALRAGCLHIDQQESVGAVLIGRSKGVCPSYRICAAR